MDFSYSDNRHIPDPSHTKHGAEWSQPSSTVVRRVVCGVDVSIRPALLLAFFPEVGHGVVPAAGFLVPTPPPPGGGASPLHTFLPHMFLFLSGRRVQSSVCVATPTRARGCGSCRRVDAEGGGLLPPQYAWRSSRSPSVGMIRQILETVVPSNSKSNPRRLQFDWQNHVILVNNYHLFRN